MSMHRGNARILPALMVFALAGCGGGGGETAETSTPSAEKAAPAVVENAATLNFAVNFDGAVPAMANIDMAEEKACNDKHTTPQKVEEVVVNGGKLQNVFVYVKEGISGTYSAPAENVLVDQDGCIYKPHVVGAVAGQNIVYRNSDGVLHNVKAVPTVNRGFNISQPVNGDAAPKTFPSAEIMVPVECNVHGWMKSYVGVVSHPYFGVSAADGSVRIGNLPPGTYTIEAWHEKFGVQTQSVTVGPNETKDVTFTFSAATATRVPLGDPIVIPHASAHAGSH